MNTKYRAIALFGGLLMTVAAAVATAEFQGTLADGLGPYTPTRIEWLCVEFNSASAIGLTTESRHWLHATYQGRNPNAVVISVGYLPSMDRQLLNTKVNNAREELQAMAKQHGWGWVTIVEDVKMLSLAK